MTSHFKSRNLEDWCARWITSWLWTRRLFLTRACLPRSQLPPMPNGSPRLFCCHGNHHCISHSDLVLYWKHEAYVFHIFSKFTFFVVSRSNPSWNMSLSSTKIINTYSPTLRFSSSHFYDRNSNSPWNGFHIFQMIRLSERMRRDCGPLWSYLRHSFPNISRISLQIPNGWETMWGRLQMRCGIFVSIPRGTDECGNSCAALFNSYGELGASWLKTGCFFRYSYSSYQGLALGRDTLFSLAELLAFR